MKVFVIGHLSPDLDAIASAAAYAEFLTKSKRYGEMQIVPARAGEPNKETKYVFEKFGVEMPEFIEDFKITDSDVFILVDHNEGRQRHDDIPEEQIVEVNDHHKINVNFVAPVKIDVKPFGSTSTLIYEHFDMYNVKASKKVEGVLLAAILSDTQGLKSSTTTGKDVEVANEIAESLDIDLEEFTLEIFKQKTDFDRMEPAELAKRDFKIFDFGEHEVFINQIETAEPGVILKLKPKLVKALEEAKKEEEADLGFIIITDILKVDSKIIYSTDEEKAVVEEAFVTEGHDNIAEIGSKMSRKKDIAPAIEKTLS